MGTEWSICPNALIPHETQYHVSMESVKMANFDHFRRWSFQESKMVGMVTSGPDLSSRRSDLAQNGQKWTRIPGIHLNPPCRGPKWGPKWVQNGLFWGPGEGIPGRRVQIGPRSSRHGYPGIWSPGRSGDVPGVSQKGPKWGPDLGMESPRPLIRPPRARVRGLLNGWRSWIPLKWVISGV